MGSETSDRDRSAAGPVGRSIAIVLAAYLASRVLVAVAVAVFVARNGGIPYHGVPFPYADAGAALDPFVVWDAAWYVDIARHGYETSFAEVSGRAVSMAFFPLFPALIWLVSALSPLSPAAASVFLSVVFGAGATVLVWVLVRRLAGDRMGRRAAVLFAFFPGSFVFSMGYAEALLLVLAIACLIALLSERWLLAGIAGALATATRPNALALIVCCAWAAGVAIARRREWRAVSAPLLCSTGVLSFFGFLALRSGEWNAWFKIETDAWEERFDFGASSLDGAVLALQGGAGANAEVATLGLAFVVVSAVLLWRWRPPAVLSIYAGIVSFLAIGSATLGARPRFLVTAFPLVLAVAWAARGRSFPAVLAASAVLLYLLAGISMSTLSLTP